MDDDVANISRLARLLGISVHVRGPDTAPAVEFRDKTTRRVVGGKEIKRRLSAIDKQTLNELISERPQ